MTHYYILMDIAWYLIGYVSFLYWVRFDEDITLVHLLFGLVMAFGGPFIWLMGFSIWAYYKCKEIVVYKWRSSEQHSKHS